jgi:hypothetical protein
LHLQHRENRQAPSRRWDPEDLTIAGAFWGLVAGCSFELIEIFLSSPLDIEPFGQIAAEVMAATLTGAFVFSMLSTVSKRLKRGSHPR